MKEALLAHKYRFLQEGVQETALGPLRLSRSLEGFENLAQGLSSFVDIKLLGY